jgi:hypothetical protein
MSLKPKLKPNGSMQCLGMPGVKQQLMMTKIGATAFDWFGHESG